MELRMEQKQHDEVQVLIVGAGRPSRRQRRRWRSTASSACWSNGGKRLVASPRNRA